MYSMKKIISAAAFGLIAASGAQADTLYSNGPAGTTSNWCVGDNQCGGSFEIVTPITLATDSSLSSLNFTLGSFNAFSSTNTVHVDIWNAAPTVGTWASSSVFAGNQSATDVNNFITVSLPDATLSAGQYWLGLIVANDTGISTYLASGAAGSSQQFDVSAGTFSPNFFNATVPLMAVQVNGVSAVPEPGSIALLLAGLGLVGVTARRRKLK